MVGGQEVDKEQLSLEHLSWWCPSGDVPSIDLEVRKRPGQETKISNGNRGHALGKIQESVLSEKRLSLRGNLENHQNAEE